MTSDDEFARAILTAVLDLLEEDGHPRSCLTPNDRLLDIGLDSLGLAVLVTRLEDELGIDPFRAIEFQAPPTTIGELLALYSSSREC